MSGSPDRAAGLKRQRIVMADPVLLFFRRNLDSVLSEAKKTTPQGFPTDIALASLHWIQVDNTNLDMADEEDRVVHFRSFAGACEMLGLDVRKERKRMLLEIKAAYAAAAVAAVQHYVSGRLSAVLTCSGIRALHGRQYVLGLVSDDEYAEVAGIDRPDPPARTKRSKHKVDRQAAC